MADKSFGVDQLDILGTGTPTISAPNQLNLDAHTVAISTSVTVGEGMSAVNISATGISTIAQPANSNPMANWTITNNSASAYRFTGPGQSGSDDNPDLYLVRGHRYIFKHNATTNHPIQIRVASGGAAYTDGITYSDVSNNATTHGNNLIFNVQHDAPARLYYQCTSHGPMVGNIYIIGGPQVISGVVTATTFVGNLTGTASNNAVLTGSTNNTLVTVTGSNAITGEANLTFDGSSLSIGGKNTLSSSSIITYSPDSSVRYQMGVNNTDGVSLLSKNTSGSYNTYQIDANTFKVRTTGTNTPAERLRILSNGHIAIGDDIANDTGMFKVIAADGQSDDQYVGQFKNLEASANRNWGLLVQAGSSSTDESLRVRNYANNRDHLLIRGDGVKVTQSRGGNYAKTFEFNYNDGAPGGQQTKSLATISTYNDVTSAVAEVTYVGVYGTANNYISSSKWICAVRRGNNNSVWNQTAAETATGGNSGTSSLDIYWSNGQLYAQTVGPWMGWTVNVRLTILNGDITVNV